MKKIFVINCIFFFCNLNSNSGLRHSIKSFLIAPWNFLSFRVSQFVTSLEPPALTFYNLALFSIYVNDGTTISRSSVIILINAFVMFSVLLYGKTLDLASYDSFGVNLLIILRGFATQIAITFNCFITTFNGVRLRQ